MGNFSICHDDHGITGAQLHQIEESLRGVGVVKGGHFIKQIDIPSALGSVPCSLHGPAMGDDPIFDGEVELVARGDRPWKDRMVDREDRPVNYVQCIGIRDGDDFLLFTVYGGPLAPQNPEDPSNEKPGEARDFWAQHALSL